MFRKLSTLLTAVVVIFAMLPAMAASAAPASSATLTSASTIFPSATDADTSRATTPFTIRVNNSDGITQLLTPINAISITFPPNVSAPSCEAITGWTCTAIERPGPDALLLKNGAIMAGGNQSFTFAGVVSAPRTRDANGNLFVVDVSSDGGQTYGRATGSPAFNVRVFEVLNLAVGATRLTGGLQDTTASYQFRDHSSDGVAADPQLNLANGAGQTATRTALTPAGTLATSLGTATFAIDTTAPTTSNGTQVVQVAANPQAQGVIAETPAAPLTIERTPDVGLNANTLQINGASRSVISRGSSSYTVRIAGSKLYPPAVLAADGFATTLTLSAPGITPVVLQLASTSQTKELVRGHNTALDLTYVTDGDIAFPNLTESATLDAVFEFSGTDDNGAPFSEIVELLDLIEIDVDIPSVTIDSIVTGNPDASRVKDGDTITITGAIASNDDEFDIQLPEGFTIALTNGSGFSTTNRDETDPIAVTFTNGGQNYEATYTVPEGTDTETVLGDLGLVTASASVRDLAGNTSLPAFAFLDIDNLAPMLSPRGAALGYYYLDGGQPRVRVTFDEGGPFGDRVEGGCLPTQWSIPGVSVTAVRYHDGATSCLTGTYPGDPAAGSGTNMNDRVLVLDRALNLDTANEIPVTYDAEGPLNLGVADDVTDQAANIGPSDAASIVDGRIPNLPVISLFERGVRETADGTDYEVARTRQGCRVTGGPGCPDLSDRTNYYTNADVRTAVTGGRFATDTIEIVRFDPTVPADNPGRYTVVGTLDYSEDRFALPITTCAAPCEVNDQTFGLRFVREVPRGNNTFDYLTGPVAEFLVTYDVVNPTVGTATASAGDGDDVLVRFSEDIAAGYDSADDWSIGQDNTDPNSNTGDNEFYTRPQSVTPTDNGNERLIEAQPLPGYPVFGALYEFISNLFDESALRYEDYAGNFTGNGLSSTQ
jgi:hypothetical protein